MPRQLNKLTAKSVQNLKQKNDYPDGNGLYLQVSKTGSKSWFFRYTLKGKAHKQGLGPYPEVTLSEARDEAITNKKLTSKGIDPIAHKNEQARIAKQNNNDDKTFEYCANMYYEKHKRELKNGKHIQQWINTLRTYVFPSIGHMHVSTIQTNDIVELLNIIWVTKTETATRVRQRIEAVFDWAIVSKYRTDENPALWRGRLDKLLPKPTKLRKVKHFASLPYQELPAYFKHLFNENTLTCNTLAFLILTATRSNEARFADWKELDINQALWTIPEERMKADRIHRIPLSHEALTLIERMKSHKQASSNLLFHGQSQGRPICDTAIRNYVQKSFPKLTVHGFRSTFRVWCTETLDISPEVMEKAMAHSTKDKTIDAYLRSDLFVKRRDLMQKWADYCMSGC